jgi:hypothetical protein
MTQCITAVFVQCFSSPSAKSNHPENQAYLRPFLVVFEAQGLELLVKESLALVLVRIACLVNGVQKICRAGKPD